MGAPCHGEGAATSRAWERVREALAKSLSLRSNGDTCVSVSESQVYLSDGSERRGS